MPTITIEVPERQLVEWVQRLSLSSKRLVLQTIIPELDELEALVDYGSERIRSLCSERGIDWDSLSEEERERLIDDILHEA